MNFCILSSNDLLKSGILIMIIGYRLENIKGLWYLVKAITWYVSWKPEIQWKSSEENVILKLNEVIGQGLLYWNKENTFYLKWGCI